MAYFHMICPEYVQLPSQLREADLQEDEESDHGISQLRIISNGLPSIWVNYNELTTSEPWKS